MPRPDKRTLAAVDHAARIDWRGAEDRRLLRAACRYLRDQLGAHIYARWTLPAQASGLYVSTPTEVEALLDLLLECEALDLIGTASLIRGKTEREIHRARTVRRRRKPTPTAARDELAPGAKSDNV